MRLIDTHCHLDMLPSWLEGEVDAARRERDLADVVERARAAGVRWMLNPGVAWDDMPGVLAVSERFEEVFASVGLHPHEANHWGEDGVTRLKALAAHPRVLAIGEIGLDYYYTFSEPATQKRAFAEQLALAGELDLPVIIHSRDAEDDTLAALSAARNVRGVMHCFTGTLELAQGALELGYHVSFSGVVTFKKSESLREVARLVPLERTLIETDSPYLAPPPNRGKRNEPANVAQVAAVLAEVHGVSVEAIAEATTRNAIRLFGFPQ